MRKTKVSAGRLIRASGSGPDPDQPRAGLAEPDTVTVSWRVLLANYRLPWLCRNDDRGGLRGFER